MRARAIDPLRPARSGVEDGLPYALWLPEDADRSPAAGVVIVHGAGSCKESHYDFARAAIAPGIAALSFDQRGHGESEGPMDGRAIDDVVSMAELLRRELGDPAAPVALRGSSMGGCFAILAAQPAQASAVVAICPASTAGLRRGLRAGSFQFDADADAVEALLLASDLPAAVESLSTPLLLLHAQGDEQVPVQHSRELATAARAPGSRLIEVPGGHHRSVQHDDELQAVSLRFLERALGLR
ncbi:MAG: alpha/beta hydrolase family protein [Solirubrobacteraceae bacterium]